ncbi:MAG: ribokinase [Pseudomonadota bacterium]
MTGKPAQVVCVASWNADLVSRVARPIGRGETLMASAFTTGPGGKGSNAAVAAARQGAQVGLIARIGDDDFGRMGMALWANEGISCEHVEQVAGEASGVAQILVYDDGDNSIAVFPGATAGLSAGHADSGSSMLSRCSVVMASCEVPEAVTERAFAIAREAGAMTVLNPAPARPLSDALALLVDVLTPNESELKLLAGSGAQESLDAAAQALLKRGVGAVLVTLGAAGCALYRAGEPTLKLPGRRMNVLDTIGAGDTFTGALSAALARGEPLAEAMACANAAAALSVTGQGAIGAMPTLAQVRELLGAESRAQVG